MDALRTFVFAAGGTGGHLYPAVAVARVLRARRPGDRVVFVGNARGLEATLVPKEGFAFRAVASGGVVGKGALGAWRGAWAMARGTWEARAMMREIRPAAVMGTGGYASVPAVLAAWFADVPTLIFEPNRTFGLANRLLRHVAERVAVAFEETLHEAGAKGVLTGTPVRAMEAKPREHEKFGVLVVGGSQGAEGLNAVMRDALPLLAPHADTFFMIHMRGKGKGADLEDAYRRAGVEARIADYLDDMPQAYAQADVVVARAGAVTLAEIAALGKAAILVPLPHSAGDHQRDNARAFERAGAALCLDGAQATGAALAEALVSLSQSPGRLRSMAERSRALGHPRAAERMADEMERLAGGCHV